METCRTCRFYVPGDRYPDYDKRGCCHMLHATGEPKRVAQIRPSGNAWLEVSHNFGCTLHREKDDAR